MMRKVDYSEQMRFDSLERAYLDLPDVDEVLPHDDWFGEMSDRAYEQRREDEILGRNY